MKRLLVGLLAVILLLLAGVTVLAFRAVQDTPLVTGDGVLSPSAINRAKTVVRLNDPRRLRPGTQRESRVLAPDLETLVNLTLRRGHATVVLEEGLADLRYTLAVPPSPLGRYLNLWARVAVGPAGLEFHKVRVGSVPIPGPLFRMALDHAIDRSDLAPDIALLRQTVQHIAFVPGELRIRYTWKPEILDSARARVMPPEERERLAAAHLRLVAHMDRSADGRRHAPLADVLGPLLQEAAGTSTGTELGRTYRKFLSHLGLAERISAALVDLVDEARCDLVLTTGGTGPAPRDVTPEATLAVAHKEMPGFGEQMRQISLRFVPTAILSRQCAVIRDKSLIINLPGQPKAIQETLEGLKSADGQTQTAGIFAAVPYCIDLIGGPYLETRDTVCKAFRPKNAVRPSRPQEPA